MVGALRASLPTRRSLWAAALVVTAAVLAACGGGGDGGPPVTPVAPVDGEITVVSSEWQFEPEAIVLQQGEEVQLTLLNEGDILHNWKVEDQPEADVLHADSTGGLEGDEGELFVGADSDNSGSLTFVPRESGTYAVYCTIQTHRQLGMEGTLVIE